jgi:integrase
VFDAFLAHREARVAKSVLRRAFKFGYRDYSEKYNPTYSLKSARILKRDRTKIDPFTIQDAETLIAAIHRDWGAMGGQAAWA